MNPDTSWQQLQQAWQETSMDPVLTARIKARVRRQTVRMKLTVASEAVVAVTAFTASALLAIYHRGPDSWSLAVMVWCFTIAACAFSFLNRKGLWDAEHDSVSLLKLSLRRAESKARAADFGIVLAFVEVVLLVTWEEKADWFSARHRSLWWPEVCLVLAGGATIAWLFYYRARARREGNNLKSLLQSLET